MSVPDYDGTNSPQTLTRMLDSHDTKDAKIRLLKKIKDDCFKNVSAYKKKYRKLKRIDTLIDISNSLLTGISISLTISGMAIPPLLIASASLSGLTFVSSRVQDKANLKAKYTSHNQTFQNYSDLARSITVVLAKNNLSQAEYHNFIQETLDRISLIESSQLF